MAEIDLNTSASVPEGTSLTITVFEDVDGDGQAENTANQAIDDGTNTYALSGFEGASGNEFWIEAEFGGSDITKTAALDSVGVGEGGGGGPERVEASVTTLQFIPGKEENPSRGGHPLNSGLIQVFAEGTTIETSAIPLVDQDLPLKPVLDSWIAGDMRETLPEYLRAEDFPADYPGEVRGALDPVQGKYLDDVGPTEPFREFRFHNGITVTFDVLDEGSIDQESVEIEFSEGGVKPDDGTVLLGGLGNSNTILHDQDINGIPWREWYEGNVEHSNRRPRYYKYDTEYEFDGVDGVRVTTIAGGWAGFIEDISERVAADEAAFFHEVMDWPIPLWQARLAMFLLPNETHYLGDFLAAVPNTYSFLDFIVLADGRRYVRVWDASAYPSLATYVDGEQRALDQMPYEPQELLFNYGMDKFFAQAIAGITPYTAPLPLYVLMIEYPDLAEFFLSFVIEQYVPLGGYAASALLHETPRLTLGYHGPNGSAVEDPSAPFDSVIGQLLPLSGTIEAD